MEELAVLMDFEVVLTLGRGGKFIFDRLEVESPLLCDVGAVDADVLEDEEGLDDIAEEDEMDLKDGFWDGAGEGEEIVVLFLSEEAGCEFPLL